MLDLMDLPVVRKVNTDVKKTRRQWVRILNADRVGKCALNDFLWDEDGITPIAIHCNCSHYHIVLNNKVVWDPRVAIKEKKLNLTISKVREKIKEFWIREL